MPLLSSLFEIKTTTKCHSSYSAYSEFARAGVTVILTFDCRKLEWKQTRIIECIQVALAVGDSDHRNRDSILETYIPDFA
jgi:hypothetical protein